MRTELDCIFFIDQPPVITVRDGMVHICYEIGKEASFELVMSRHNFLRARRVAARAEAQLDSGTARVLPMRRGKAKPVHG